MFEAAIFDLDGLLVDSEQCQLDAWNEYLKQFDVQLDESEAPALVDRRDYDTAEHLYRQHRLSVDPVTMMEARNEIFIPMAEERVEALPGAVELVKYLKEQGWRLAIISAGVRDYIYAMIDKLGLDLDFDVIVAGDMIDASKPAPMPFLACAETFALHPSHCLAFDDSRAGVEAARGANMKVVCVPGPRTERWRITGADLVVNSLEQITLNSLRSLWVEANDVPRLQPQLQPQTQPRRWRR